MRKSNQPFIIAIAALSVVAVCSIGVAVGFGLGLFDDNAAGSKAATTQVATASEKSTSSATASSASAETSAAASKSSESASKEATSNAGTTSSNSNSTPRSASTVTETTSSKAPINIKKTEDYRDVNLFLSNFAEWGEFYRNGASFDRENYDLRQLVNWAMWHNALNNSSSLETKAVDLPGAPASEASKGISGMPATTYPRHMNTELIESTIEKYVGLAIDLSGYNSGDGAYYERDGVMYEGLYRGDAEPHDSVVLADKVVGLGGSIVRVDFTVYSGNSSYEVVSDKSWYSLDGEKLKTAMKASGAKNVTTQTGTAFIEVIGSGSNRTFNLVSFEIADKKAY